MAVKTKKKNYTRVENLSDLEIGSPVFINIIGGRNFREFEIRERYTYEKLSEHNTPEQKEMVKNKEKGWHRVHHRIKRAVETEEEYNEYRGVIRTYFKSGYLYWKVNLN